MPIYQLSPTEIWFPEPELFEPDQDVVAIGGDISAKRLLAAYQHGIFPWYQEGEPIMWWHPRQRFILPPGEIKVTKSSRNLLNRNMFRFSFNTAFEQVIENCQNIKRSGQDGTWLSDELKANLIELNRRGHAFSAECWEGDELVGGLYGLIVGGIFMGDSMFSKRSNASKLTFIKLCEALQNAGFLAIDCQVYTEHLASLGAYEIPRSEFIELLEKANRCQTGPIKL